MLQRLLPWLLGALPPPAPLLVAALALLLLPVPRVVLPAGLASPQAPWHHFPKLASQSAARRCRFQWSLQEPPMLACLRRRR